MQGSESVKKGKVISYAGSVIALLIGSGFATGQEITQYFVSYGYKGILGAGTCFILLTYTVISFGTAGYREQFVNINDIYRYYAGNKLGTFYDFFSVLFIFLSYTVMISGASATGVQHYHWHPLLGGIIVATATIIVVLFGLNGIVEVIGHIGPVIVVVSIGLGIVGIGMFQDKAAVAQEQIKKLIESKKILQASSHWFLAAGSYVGFSMLWLAAFVAGIGKKADSEKEIKYGVTLGALGFSLAVTLMTLALIFATELVGGSNIPNLLLAGHIHPLFAHTFSVIIMLGIFTTAVPLMWSVVARFFKEGTCTSKIAAAALTVIGAIIGLALDFGRLVNIVYVIDGYIGFLLLFIMIIQSIRRKKI